MTTPSLSKYDEQVAALDEAIRESIAVSHACAGIPAPTGAHYYASVLFTSLCTRAVSLAILVPRSKWSTHKVVEHWDFASVAGIVRSLLEVRLALFYLAIEKCSGDEWNCRWNLFNLHDCTSRIRLFEAMPGAEEDLAGFQEQAADLRARLLGNPFFMRLPAKQRNRLINGGHAYLHSLEEIGSRAGIDVEAFRLMYRLFSNQAHSFPISFYRMGEQNRGRGVHSTAEEGYTLWCIELAVSLLNAARDEMKALFDGITAQPGADRRS